MNPSLADKLKLRISAYRINQRLKQMDREYYHSILHLILPHPPSVYIRYSPEEIAQMEKESMERIQKLIDELE